MKLIWIVCILIACTVTPAAEPPILDTVATRLERAFVARLADPARYERDVLAECSGFPEGDLFPFTLTAMALAFQAQRHPERADVLRSAIAVALRSAEGRVARKLAAPQGDLLRVRDYARQGVYLGQFALALASWRDAGGDGRFDALQSHCCGLLLTALQAAEGAPIASYPTYTWTFDTIPALVAVQRWEQRANGARAVPLWTAHQEWLTRNGTDAATGLPFSIVSKLGAPSPPRGCELSWRIALLSAMDPPAAAGLYRAYKAAFWSEKLLYAGFREFPKGNESREDVDSGPIIDGIGLTATGLGIAAARSQGDLTVLRRLAQQLELFPHLRAAAQQAHPDLAKASLGRMPNDPRYFSGFLFGDVALFYALAWRPDGG